MWLFWLIFSVALTVFVLYSAFPIYFVINRAVVEGIWVPPGMRVIAKIWFVVGAPADVIYNLLFGSHEVETFSQYLQGEVDNGNHTTEIRRWVTFINFVAPGHIDDE